MWIYGNGGHAKVVRYLLFNGLRLGWMDGVPLHYIDDEDGTLWSDAYEKETGIIAIGNNRSRKLVAFKINHASYFTLWSTLSSVVTPIDVGLGTVVMPQAAVNPGAVVGRHCIINTGATVDHDSRVGDFAHIAPGSHLCGNVTVEEGALIGAGTIVTPGIRIGAWLTIPAGSVVTRDCLNEDDVAALRKR